MKNILQRTCSLVVVLLLMMSCAETKAIQEEVRHDPVLFKTANESPTQPSEPSHEEPPLPAPETFTVKSGGISLTAQVNSFGSVTILNYPTEWRGKIKLVRYDGVDSSTPFSQEHCDGIKSLATGGAAFLVRSNYHSRLSFEMPFFLTSEFVPTVLQAANAAGFRFSALEITNPPERIKASAELKVSDDGITMLLGGAMELAQQFNLGARGSERDSGFRFLNATSGDVLCDFASGKVELVMSYPINGEERVVKTIYSSMDIDMK